MFHEDYGVLSYSLSLHMFLLFMCLEVVSRISCSTTSPGIKVKLTSLQFLWSFFLRYLKLRMILAFFHTLGAYVTQSDYLKVIKSVLAMKSDSSLSTHVCIPSGPMDLCMSIFFKFSLAWSSSMKVKSSLLQTYPVVSEAWVSLRLYLFIRTESNNVLSTLAFFMPSSLVLFNSRLIFCLVFLLLFMYLWKPFLFSFTSPAPCSSSRSALTFLTPSLQGETEALYSSWGISCCFHLLAFTSFLCPASVKSSLLMHADLLLPMLDFLLGGMDRF